MKYEVINTSHNKFLDSPLLEFSSTVNKRTGEMGVYNVAYYKGLKFKIFEPTISNELGRITIGGSLHKYWNDGCHNFNDFGENNLVEVLNDLDIKFGLKSKNCVMHQLEIGVNICVEQTINDILTNCLLHRGKRIEKNHTHSRGNFYKAEHQQYAIKIYDKQIQYQKQYNVPKKILRFEIKYRKMHPLNKLGIYTMYDLIKYGLCEFKSKLIKEWESVLFYDYKVLDGTKYENTYSNSNYWKKLKPSNFKYHRRKLSKFINEHPQSLKKEIENLIFKKADQLTSKTTQINPLSIGLKRVV